MGEGRTAGRGRLTCFVTSRPIAAMLLLWLVGLVIVVEIGWITRSRLSAPRASTEPNVSISGTVFNDVAIERASGVIDLLTSFGPSVAQRRLLSAGESERIALIDHHVTIVTWPIEWLRISAADPMVVATRGATTATLRTPPTQAQATTFFERSPMSIGVMRARTDGQVVTWSLMVAPAAAIALGLGIVVMAAMTAIVTLDRIRTVRRTRAFRCADCGHSLLGLSAGRPCPECGRRRAA